MPINNPFLKATPLYKEYAILELLSKDSNITQRAIAKELDSSLSMINQYLEEYEKRRLINRVYINSKNMKYAITDKGYNRFKQLNMMYLKYTRKLYLDTKNIVVDFLNTLVESNFKRIIMYGAGNVCQLILQIENEEENFPLKILYVVDDDETKIGKELMGITIKSFEDIDDMNYDGILISSYNHNETIFNKLNSKIDKDKIIRFF